MAVPVHDGPIASPRLRRLVRAAAAASPAAGIAPAAGRAGAAGSAAVSGSAAAAAEHCDLCGAPIPSEHRHLLDLRERALRCACRACSLLFDRSAAGGGHYRLVPDRVWLLEDFELDDARWAGLRIPVGIAFLFRSSAAGRVVAFYPSPAGATESLLELETWKELEADNPVLGAMAPDVEALLVNRARGARAHWLAPVDACYRLVGLIRTNWKGLGGGAEVWAGIERYFDELRRCSRRVNRDGAPL